MKEKIRIGVLAESFIEWSGGVEFLKYILLGIGRNENYEITLLIPDRNTKSLYIKNIIKEILKVFKIRYKIIKYPPVNDTCNFLANYLNVKKYIVFKNKEKFIDIVNENFDIILPSFDPLSSAIKIPVINYLYDFQYKYFPEFFSKEEVNYREESFKKHINNDVHIIINAIDVQKDIEKFYSRTNNIHVIPFTPIFDKELFVKIPGYEFLKNKYKLNGKPYFIISNQFWKHKGHQVAFEALNIAINELKLDFNIVCTGLFPDVKNESHCNHLKKYITKNNLTDRVHFVGFIDKCEQLGLMLNSCAVLQPTQFEGGPGGFSVFEALAYHQRCIVSDIDVNKEIKDNPLIAYFKVNNAWDLANRMEVNLSYPPTVKDSITLYNEFELKRKKLEDFFSKLINNVLTSHKNNVSD